LVEDGGGGGVVGHVLDLEDLVSSVLSRDGDIGADETEGGEATAVSGAVDLCHVLCAVADGDSEVAWFRGVEMVQIFLPRHDKFLPLSKSDGGTGVVSAPTRAGGEQTVGSTFSVESSH